MVVVVGSGVCLHATWAHVVKGTTRVSADYTDKPLEKPLKLVLKVGGSEVTELSGSGHDSSYYDDRSDHERERHKEKKKKKKKKSEKEKHLDDEERRKRKVQQGGLWHGGPGARATASLRGAGGGVLLAANADHAAGCFSAGCLPGSEPKPEEGLCEGVWSRRAFRLRHVSPERQELCLNRSHCSCCPAARRRRRSASGRRSTATRRGKPTTSTPGRRWRWSRPPTDQCEPAGRSQASAALAEVPGASELAL